MNSSPAELPARARAGSEPRSIRSFLGRAAVLGGLASAVALMGTFSSTTESNASSHREAPYIMTDPTADATDLYAYVAADATGSVTLIANYIPDISPASGPNFHRFDDNVLYEINVDNDGDAIEDITFQFRFRTEINPANPFGENTFLYNTAAVTSLADADLNQRQFYTVTMFTGEGGAARTGTVIASDLQAAPSDVGPKSFPTYDAVAAQAVHTIGSGIKVFAGPRDDPFFLDLGGIFDLLNVGVNPEDYLKGKNVHTIALQIPKAQLSASGAIPTSATDPNAIIGVRTTSYRQGVRVFRELGNPAIPVATGVFGGPGVNRGPWIQLSRLDLPLINEVIIPLKDKNRFNGSKPKNDGQFAGYVTGTAVGSIPTAAPHLGALLELVLGVDVPPAPRTDLVDALLLGIPSLNRPAGVVASSQLRLNMMVAPAATPNRLGVLAGDNAGFPNGRRLADDVVDISLAVVGGVLVDGRNATLGDGVNTNDKAFMSTFPYLAAPHSYDD